MNCVKCNVETEGVNVCGKTEPKCPTCFGIRQKPKKPKKTKPCACGRTMGIASQECYHCTRLAWARGRVARCKDALACAEAYVRGLGGEKP